MDTLLAAAVVCAAALAWLTGCSAAGGPAIPTPADAAPEAAQDDAGDGGSYPHPLGVRCVVPGGCAAGTGSFEACAGQWTSWVISWDREDGGWAHSCGQSDAAVDIRCTGDCAIQFQGVGTCYGVCN